MELANRSKVIEDLKVSLTLLLDKYNELKKNYDRKINTFLVAPMSKNIQNTINKDTVRFNHTRLYIEKSSFQLNMKNNNSPLMIQSFKRKISLEQYEKLNENLISVTELLKDKEKYSKMKDNEIKRLEVIVKEYELMKISLEELNKKHLELKKYNESNQIELDFFKEETDKLKNNLEILLKEKLNNQDLVNNAKKNYELLVDSNEKLKSSENICIIKTEEIQSLLKIQKELNETIYLLREENSALKEENNKIKENINKVESELLDEKEKRAGLESKSIEEKLSKEEIKNEYEKKIESYIKNEVKYIDMLQHIKEKTKSSYENFHKVFLDQEIRYDKKLEHLKFKLDSIKMKIVKKINRKFIEAKNILVDNKSSTKNISLNSTNSISQFRKICFQGKFEILSIPARNNSTNLIIKQTINNAPITNIRISTSEKIKGEESEVDYHTIIENYKKFINELKNDLKDKMIKLEKHDLDKNKLIYQIQNYERFMKESEKKLNDNNEKTNQMELTINQLNSKIDIMNKENLKAQKNIITKIREDLANKEENLRQDYIQQISNLKNQINQYKIENEGKSKIIEERNEEIKLLKSHIK